MSLTSLVSPYTAPFIITPDGASGVSLEDEGTFTLSSDREWYYATEDTGYQNMARVAADESVQFQRRDDDVGLYLRTRQGVAALTVAFAEVVDAPGESGSGTGVTASETATLTNKRITRRVVALVDAATVTPNADTTDLAKLATVSQATLLANASGTPTDGQLMEWRITSAAVKALTFGNKYTATSIAIPTATAGGGQTERWLWEWSAAASLWYLIAYNPGA